MAARLGSVCVKTYATNSTDADRSATKVAAGAHDRKMLVSAWVPHSDILTPAKTVAELKAAGISTAVLMINDHSADRGPTKFRFWALRQLEEIATACSEAEIGVWLCSWAMPHQVFVDEAIAVLPELMERTGAEMLMWDAEAPWVNATGVFDREQAADRFAQAFSSAAMAVTAIGAAPLAVIWLARACSVWVPQCYATQKTIAIAEATPASVVPFGLRCWRERYGQEPAGHWMIGLAGYDQAPDPRVTMWPPIDDVLAAGIFSTCYWTNNSVAARPDVGSFVADLSRPLPPHPGVMQLVNMAAIPSERTPVVEQLQHLLAASCVDPGPLDGKPGPKTIAAVRALQRRRGLEATGLVDAATWAELLRP